MNINFLRIDKVVFIISLFLLVGCESGGTDIDDTDEIIDTSLQFVHPGVINGLDNLEILRQDNFSAEQHSSYNALLTFIRNNRISDSYPKLVYIEGPTAPTTATPTATQMRYDALLSYAYAVNWVCTGEANNAESAMHILNGWAENFQRFVAVKVTSEQLQLVASWIVPTFVAAAEIIRYYKTDDHKGSGWTSEEIQQFSDFLNKMIDDYVDPMIIEIDQNNRRLNNWGASAGYTKMAAGIFLNEKSIYDDGKRIINKLIPIVIKPDGQVYELCERDCSHPQYSMTAFTYSAEIARIQGDETLYKLESNRIEKGWEWTAKAFAGQLDCRDCSTSKIFPAVELAVKYYDASTHLALFARKQRPYNQISSLFIGFTTLTHFSK